MKAACLETRGVWRRRRMRRTRRRAFVAARRTASAALGPAAEADDAKRTAADASEDASSRDCASCARVPTLPPVLREQQAKGATCCGPRCSISRRESRAHSRQTEIKLISL